MRLARWKLVAVSCVALTLLAGSGRALQAQGTVAGRVTVKGSNEPLGDARVMLVGTSVITSTSQDGRYTLQGVPAGSHEVRAIKVGYEESKQTVTVSTGQTSTLDFAMTNAVIKLSEVVTTATGEQRKVELGNTISTLGDVSTRVEQGSINNLGELLQAKVPGVNVLSGAETGAAPVIRIRGLNSLSLTNAPIFIIDGVRMITSTTGTNAFEATPTTSYLNDLDPASIEDIEIVKGPSAATLYGTDAANGVIVITTKKGRAGNTKWTWNAEDGTIDDRGKYQGSYAIFGHSPTAPTIVTRCVLTSISAGTCIADSTSALNVLRTDSLTTLGYGHRSEFSSQVSGGSDVTRYFVSADVNNEVGPYQMPLFSQQRLDSIGTGVLPTWLHPEDLQRTNLQTNLSANLSPNFDITVNSGFLLLNERFPQVDNNFLSSVYESMQGPGFDHPGPGYSDVGLLGETLHGYASYVPSEINQYDNNEQTQRFTGSSNANWRPFAWLQNTGTVGMDLADNLFTGLCRLNQCADLGNNRTGLAASESIDLRNFSAKLTSTASWQATQWANFKTTAGADYTNSESDNSSASTQILPPGAITVGAGSVPAASNQYPTATKTLGGYLQEQLALRDRLFLTVAVRRDENTAFGTAFPSIVYPKASLSWLLSDESFFPKFSWLDQFRVRTAWGESGVEPGATAALASFGASSVNVVPAGSTGGGVDTPSLAASTLALTSLKPETSAEFEGGFDIRALNNRANLELTYYSKESSNALINVPIAASASAPVTQVLTNLGAVKNAGIEATLTTQLADTRRLGWDVTISASHNSNKVVNLGLTPTGLSRLSTGLTGTTRDTTGYPLDAFFFQKFTYADANNDKIITLNEIQIQPTFSYNGYEEPRDIVSVQNGFDLLSRKLRINILMDYRGGSSLVNQELDFQCVNGNSCAYASIQGESLFKQAAAVAARQGSPATTWGFLEDNAFWRLREVSATLTLPDRFAARFARAQSVNLTFAARNLWVWTRYTGADPEETSGAGDVQGDVFSQGPRTYFTGKITLHY